MESSSDESDSRRPRTGAPFGNSSGLESRAGAATKNAAAKNAATPQEKPSAPPAGLLGYPTEFWWAYAANASLVIANSLLIRYAEFVRLWSPEEASWHLGWICGVGMLGSVVMRLVLGVGMDVYGPRRVWLLSAAGFIACALGHLLITAVDSWPVYLLRILMTTSLAGVFGASMVYVSRRATPERMAEVIGMLGTSGFLGMMIGPAIGDWLFPGGHPTHAQVQTMFAAAATAGFGALVFGALATRGQAPAVPMERVPLFQLLRRHSSVTFVLIGLMMGIGLNFPLLFLADFARTQNLSGISTFFWVYAPTAFLARLASRRFPEQYGVRRMSQAGLLLLVGGYLLFFGVRESWQLALPACVLGAGHALIFPSVIAGGASLFPERFRGLGTSLMLMAMDVGTLVGGPLVSTILVGARRLAWPEYPTVFAVIAASFLVTLVIESLWNSLSSPTAPATAETPVDQAAAEKLAVETPVSVPAAAAAAVAACNGNTAAKPAVRSAVDRPLQKI